MSGDARYIVAEGFSNCQGGLEEGDHDTSLEYDLESDETRYFGVTDNGEDNYRPAISRDGNFVLWAMRPPGTRGEYVSRLQVFDRSMGTTVTLPLYAFHYGSTDISDSGDVIAFSSNGQVYRYVISTDEIALASAGPDGAQGDGTSDQVSLSGDGRYLVFRSRSANLVDGDTNAFADIFLFDAMNEGLERLSVAPDGSESDDDSQYPSISGDGAKVSFSSKARNLLPLATSGNFQLYVRTLTPR
jgi:Tol biopolymer transport system component